MNNIDKKNIERIINIRKTVFDEGGHFSIDEFNNMSTSDLEQILIDYYNKNHILICQEIKEKVDKLFEEHGDEDSNTILLAACIQDCGGRDLYVVDNPLSEIKFARGIRYNKWVYPVGYELFDDIYSKCSNQDKKSRDEISNISNEIVKLIYKDEIQPIDDFFDDNDSVNQVWYGCYGITKDYKLISFVIRDDGLMLNNKKPDVIYDFSL